MGFLGFVLFSSFDIGPTIEHNELKADFEHPFYASRYRIA